MFGSLVLLNFVCGGGAEKVGSVRLSQLWIFARLLGARCRGSAFLVLARDRRLGCGLSCNFLGALGHWKFSWVRHVLCWSRGRRRPWCIWTCGWMWWGIGRSDRCKISLINRLLVKKTVCASWVFTRSFIWFLGMRWFFSFVGLSNVPFYCSLGFSKEFWDELFGESWPCGEEVVFLLRISVWMGTGSTARDGERCIDRLLIWCRIDYADEFLLLSYFNFLWVLEVPCTEMFYCRVFRTWCVCWSFCWLCVLFIVKNCDASVVAEHANWEECLVFEVRENMCMSCFDGESVLW